MLQTRQLTFQFDRSVIWANDQQVPEVMEVAVIPLANPSYPTQGTFVGGLQTQTVVLTNTVNTLSFGLVPSHASGLSQPVLYRAEWRQGGITGRTYSQDFAMPDQDVAWDQLADLGDFVDGTNYVSQAQVGVANGVAALNADGLVVDATNTPVPTESEITTLTTNLATEVTDREAADVALASTVAGEITDQVNELGTTVADNLASAVTSLTAAINSNYTTLNNAITDEASTRITVDATHTSEISLLQGAVSDIDNSLDAKADLVMGVLKTEEIPPSVVRNVYFVADETAMLALSATGSNGEQPAIVYSDLAWRLDNNTAWVFIGGSPDTLDSWRLLSPVISVNGDTGDVVVDAASAGAVGVGGSYGYVTQAQVQDLDTTLATYTPLTDFTTLNSTVSGILANTNYVMLATSGPSQGYIDHTQNDFSMAYVNDLSEVTLKDGTVIASGLGTITSVNGQTVADVVLTAADVGAVDATTGTLPENRVVNLVSDLAARVLTSDSRLTNARTPTAHHVTHEIGGSDVLTLAMSQISGLAGALADLAPLTDYNNQAAQIATLQSQVTFLLGGGTPSSSPIKANWYDGTAPFTSVAADQLALFQTEFNVQLKGPFGKAASDHTYYYNPDGADANEWQYVYITPMGHLELRTWNEAAGPDIVYATQAALDIVSSSVASKASSATVSTLQTQVNALPTYDAVHSYVSGVVASYALSSTVNSLTTTVGSKAAQSAVDAIAAVLPTSGGSYVNVASQSALVALGTTISGLATQTDLNTLSTTVSGLSATVALKADLVSGTVPLAQIASLPESKITNLVSDLAAKADLVSGTVPLAELPDYPTSKVTNLDTTLAAKADLVMGKVPTSQLPDLAVMAVYTAADTTALLSLSPTPSVGDICVVTGGGGAGNYILGATPASDFGNWILMTVTASVTSVNTFTGVVNLTAADVGAVDASTGTIAESQVVNLVSDLAALASSADLTAAVANLQSLTQVQGILTASTEIKQPCVYVATTPVSTSGISSIDGVTISNGNRVLLTAQSSSIANGVWVVNSTGAWTRPTDYNTGSYLVKGTLVFVQSGNTYANTIWQVSGGSGVIGTDASTWANIMAAGAPNVYTNGNGLNLSSSTFSVKPASGGGIAVSGSGVAVDTSVVCRKYVGYVPAGSTLALITHNLNTTDVTVSVKEVATGNHVLAGITVTGANTLYVEFNVPPATNQYRATVHG